MEDKEDESRLPPVGGGPWLVYTHSESKRFQTFCEISSKNSTSYIKSIPGLRGKSICASCRGWLILHDIIDRKMVSLWNPFTLQSISLPRLPIDDIDIIVSEVYEVCSLITSKVGDSNGSSNEVCVVLFFFGSMGFLYRLNPTRSDVSSSWVRHRVELDGGRLKMYEVITMNNVLYGWARTEEFRTVLLSMEIPDDVSNSLTIKSLPMPWPKSGIACVDRVEYWVESLGHIYHVCAYIRHWGDQRISMVKVLKLDLVGRTWVEVKSLDGRAFFVGKDCSTWCWGGGGSSGSVRGNCVYFLIPEMGYENYYTYSLDEDSLTVLLSCPMLQSPYSSPVWLNMMPQHHRSSIMQDNDANELNNFKKNVVEVFDHGVISNSTKCKKHLQEKENQEGESRLSELPDHLIYLIVNDMHLFDLWNFRATCKTFQSLVPPAPQGRTNNMLPLFVFMKNDGRSCELIDPSRDESCFNILQLSSDPFAIDISKDGWLVIAVGPNRTLKYFNPFTRARSDIPVDHCMSRHSSSIGFSTYPTSDFLAIAVFSKYNGVEINYLQYGNETWDTCEFCHTDMDHKFCSGTCSPLYFARAFYVLDQIGYLGKFALVDGEGTWSVFCRPDTHTIDFHSSHLVECGGDLHAVIVGSMGMWIEVFKFNFQKEIWVKVKSLGKYSFYISHTSSFSVETADVGMQNRIYLSRLKENHIVFYSLRTRKYHVSGSEESLENFYCTKEPMQCGWL